MQHNDGGNPEKKKDPFFFLFFTVDGDGNGRKENTSVTHKGSFQHWEFTSAPPLCNRRKEMKMCQDEKAVHCR